MKTIATLFVYSLFLLFTVVGTRADFRTWTSGDGRQVEARLISKHGEDFSIELRNGQVFNLSLANVSEADQHYVRDWEFPFSPGTPENSTIIIEAGDGAGSGFLCFMDGRVFLVTNQHVIAGVDPARLTFKTADGKSYPRGPLEISPEHDLARFPVSVHHGLELAGATSFSGKVTAYGNSMGTGVITREQGEIMGMGSGMVEITAQIVPGNSGGPVVGEDGKVVGVSTLVISGTENWVTQGSRYAEARRYATVIRNGMDWQALPWDSYYRNTRTFAQEEQKLEQVVMVASLILQNPISQVSASSSNLVPEVARVLEQHREDIRYIDGVRATGLMSSNQIHSLNRSYLNRHRNKLNALADVAQISNAVERSWNRTMPYPYWEKKFSDHMRFRNSVQNRLRELAGEETRFFYLRR